MQYQQTNMILKESTFAVVFILSLCFSQIKLNVNTIPKKVNIYLDGINIGKSPINNRYINPGVHRFEIKKKGYAPLKYELLVNPSQAIDLDFFLNPIYECKFITDEPGLVFQLNGEHQWDVKSVRLNLEAGDHLLRVFKIGELIDEQTIVVDQPKKYKYFLKKLLDEN